MGSPADVTPQTRYTPHAMTGSLTDRPVLVASDGSAGANAAARVAAAIAAKHGAVPQVVRAFDTSRTALPGPLTSMLAAADAMMDPRVHEPQRNVVRTELRALFGREMHWPVHIHAGTPAGVIAREAVETNAALIVMGMRRHGLFDRVVHDETTLNVMRAAPCPVLGVAPSLTVLPRSAIVGMDFSPAAWQAARLALDLLDPHGTLVLVHVTGVREEGGPPRPASAPYEIEAELDRVVADLAPPAGVTTTRLQFDGSALPSTAAALLAVAGEHLADLVAVGSRRARWLERTLAESVSTDLARDGRHTLLVVPPLHPA